VAFLYFGLRPLVLSGRQLVGHGSDPQIFVWSLGWWPHAILHGENPFFTHALWAPQGLNLAWNTSVPGPALLLSPLTVLLGPVAAYNVAAVLMPALAAWTAFLLCRYLTRAFWPSLLGGYLFGFSSYLLGQTEGHLHMTAVFALPLIALFTVRYLDSDLGGRALTVRLGPLFAFQLLVSTEVSFTLLLGFGLALLLGYILVPERRGRLVSILPALVASSILGALLAAPFLYYTATGFTSDSLHPDESFVGDLLNFVVPTKISLAAVGWAGGISNTFPGNDAERGAYLGVPLLAMVALYAYACWRKPGARFLIVSFAATCVAILGGRLVVDGHRLFRLPWAVVSGLPVFDNVLPVRLAVYASLAAAVMASLWIAGRSAGILRWVLPVLAVVALAPNPWAGLWTTNLSVPAFFTSAAYRDCLDPGETILPLPVGAAGQALLWQAVDGYRFRMAGGDLGFGAPKAFLDSEAASLIGQGYGTTPSQSGLMAELIRDKDVSTVVVDKAVFGAWSGALDRLASGHDVGGVLLYRFTNTAPDCPGA
jgi:hypothetical protein